MECSIRSGRKRALRRVLARSGAATCVHLVILSRIEANDQHRRPLTGGCGSCLARSCACSCCSTLWPASFLACSTGNACFCFLHRKARQAREASNSGAIEDVAALARRLLRERIQRSEDSEAPFAVRDFWLCCAAA